MRMGFARGRAQEVCRGGLREHREAYCNAGLAAHDIVSQSEVARADKGGGQGRARCRGHCVGSLHIVICQRIDGTLQHHTYIAQATARPTHGSHLCCCTAQHAL